MGLIRTRACALSDACLSVCTDGLCARPCCCPQSVGGRTPFSSGTLTIRPGPGNSTAPTVLDTGMRFALTSSKGLPVQPSGTAKFVIEDLVLVNLCEFYFIRGPTFSLGWFSACEYLHAQLHSAERSEAAEPSLTCPARAWVSCSCPGLPSRQRLVPGSFLYKHYLVHTTGMHGYHWASCHECCQMSS